MIPTPKFQDRRAFFFRYLREIKRQKAKVEISVHLYPVNPKQGPDSRVASIAAGPQGDAQGGPEQTAVGHRGQYGDRRNPAAQVVPKPKKAAGYVSRTYLDSARYDIARTFWYGWDINVLGITMSNPDGSPTRAGQAFLTTREWMTAGSWKGCKDSRGVTTCRVGATKIVYASKSTSLKRPAGVTTVTTLTGASKAADTTIKVGTSPIRLS